MTVKKMIALYVRFGAAEETWKMFSQMVLHGLISTNKWMKFYDTCASWKRIGNIIVDVELDSEDNVLYKLDEYGCWKKI